MVDVTEEACDEAGEGGNSGRGTNATRKPKHARLAAKISTLHASKCTVARTKAQLQKLTSIGSAYGSMSPKRPVTRRGRVKIAGEVHKRDTHTKARALGCGLKHSAR